MPKALYIHIPFCKRCCAYCDYDSLAMAPDDKFIHNYFCKLKNALVDLSKKTDLLSHVETVYIGGGTPTHTKNHTLDLLRLLQGIFYEFKIVPQEVTLEANPESFLSMNPKDFKSAGVTRISFGVQSFNDDELSLLGRVHNAHMALEAISLAQSLNFNVSCDLMCALPGQTLKSFEKSVSTAAKLNLDHISIYPLTIEEGTLFDTYLNQNKINPVDSDTEALHMKTAAQLLKKYGYKRYEVASYAKEGRSCMHNQAYWTGKEYIGLGFSAASMLSPNNFKTYVHALKKDKVVIQKDKFIESKRIRCTNPSLTRDNSKFEVEYISEKEALIEDMILGMRLTRGISTDVIKFFKKEYPDLAKRTDEIFNLLVQDGLAKNDDTRVQPTSKGWILGNELYGRIWDLMYSE